MPSDTTKLNSPLFNRIATDFSDPEQVLEAIETQKLRKRPEMEDSFVAPRTSVELELADICAEVLGLEQIGVNDNFFRLGGNSILATQLLSKVRDKFHVDVPLRSLFEMPTVASLTVSIIQGGAEQMESAEMEQILAELEEFPDAG